MALQPGSPPPAPAPPAAVPAASGAIAAGAGDSAEPGSSTRAVGGGAGRAQLAAVATAGFLVLLKGVAAWLTNSLALGAAALDSAVGVFGLAARAVAIAATWLVRYRWEGAAPGSGSAPRRRHSIHYRADLWVNAGALL